MEEAGDKGSGMEEISEFLRHLRNLRHGYGDDLPENVVREGLYKCRTNWWSNVINGLQSLLQNKLIDDEKSDDQEMAKKVNNFLEFTDTLFPRDSAVTIIEYQDKLRTRKEIDQANKILDDVIAHLENKSSLHS